MACNDFVTCACDTAMWMFWAVEFQDVVRKLGSYNMKMVADEILHQAPAFAVVSDVVSHLRFPCHGTWVRSVVLPTDFWHPIRCRLDKNGDGKYLGHPGSWFSTSVWGEKQQAQFVEFFGFTLYIQMSRFMWSMINMNFRHEMTWIHGAKCIYFHILNWC